MIGIAAKPIIGINLDPVSPKRMSRDTGRATGAHCFATMRTHPEACAAYERDRIIECARSH
jgi:hypothetical protein